MYELIDLEFKKNFRKKTTKLALLFLIISSVIISIVDIGMYRTYDRSGRELKGLYAIKHDEENSDILDELYISNNNSEEMMNYFENIRNNKKYKDKKSSNILGIRDDIYYEKVYPYEWILTSLFQKREIENIRDDLRKGDYNKLKGLNKEAGVNEKNYTQIKMNREANMYDSIAKEWKFTRAEGIGRFIYNFSRFYIFLLVSIIIIIGPIFSEEYERNTMLLLLSTKEGKNELLHSKLIVGIIFMFIIFIVSFFPMFLIYGFVYGFSGLDSNIQVFREFVTSPYNFNMKNLLLIEIILSIVGIFSLTSITIYISTKTFRVKDTILKLILIITIPQFSHELEPVIISKLRYISPGMSLRMISDYKMMPSFYTVGKIIMNPIIFIILLNIILGILFLYLSSKSFKNVEYYV